LGLGQNTFPERDLSSRNSELIGHFEILFPPAGIFSTLCRSRPHQVKSFSHNIAVWSFVFNIGMQLNFSFPYLPFAAYLISGWLC